MNFNQCLPAPTYSYRISLATSRLTCKAEQASKRRQLAQPPRDPPPQYSSSSHSGTHDCELSCGKYNRTSWGGVGAWWTEPASDHHDLAICVNARDLVIETGTLAIIRPAQKVVQLDEDSVVVSRTWLKSILDCVDRAEVCLSEKLWGGHLNLHRDFATEHRRFASVSCATKH